MTPGQKVDERAERIRLLLYADGPERSDPELWYIGGQPTTEAEVATLRATDVWDVRLYQSIWDVRSELLDRELFALGVLSGLIGPAVRSGCTIDEAITRVLPAGPMHPLAEVEAMSNEIELALTRLHWLYPPVDHGEAS